MSKLPENVTIAPTILLKSQPLLLLHFLGIRDLLLVGLSLSVFVMVNFAYFALCFTTFSLDSNFGASLDFVKDLL